jgi:hypothetical protein
LRAERYDGRNYVLYKGGPIRNFVSDGQQWSPDECGTSKLQIICRNNAFLYEYACDNPNISMVDKVWKVNCKEESKNITFWGECIANTAYVYSTTVYEVRQHRSTYWRRKCDGCLNFEFQDCSYGSTRIGNFTVSVVEPVRFENIDKIRNICKYSKVINLRDYLNDKSRGQIYIDGKLQENDLLDPSLLSGGIHDIFVKHAYDNGTFESRHETISIIIPPSVSAGSDFTRCADYGAYFLNGTPTGGTWAGTGVTGNVFNTKSVTPNTYYLSYSKTDQYGCTASATITATVNKLPEVKNNIKTTFCNKDDTLNLSSITKPNEIWQGKGIVGNKFIPANAGVGYWTIALVAIDPSTQCQSTDSKVVNVKPNPDVYIGSPVVVCENGEPVVIKGDNPLGGVYTGLNVEKELTGKYTFNPKNLDQGFYDLTYSVTLNGCVTSKTKQAIINGKPTLKINQPDMKVCPETNSLLIDNVTPTGGNYENPFMVTTNVFSVMDAKQGSHEIKYFYTDDNGCTNSTKFNISIVPKVIVDAGPDFEVCEQDPAIKISGQYPEGGIWTSTCGNCTDEYFHPKIAGVGTYILTYKINYNSNCNGTDTRIVKVKRNPIVTTADKINACKNDKPFSLEEFASPSGGNWEVTPFVQNNIFYPLQTKSGYNVVNYTYTDSVSGCSSTESMTVSLNSLPDINAGPNLYTCLNSDPIELTGDPSDAVWSGKGINGKIFDPRKAGIGSHTLYLKKTNLNGCEGIASIIATVHEVPVVDAGEDIKVCKNTDQVNLIGLPSGGTWIGDALDGNTFSPDEVTNAKVTIKYSFTDQNQCTGVDSKVITVLPVPTVSIQSENKICENSSSLKLQGGYPLGGNWDGKGVFQNSFYPAFTGSGIKMVTYTFTDANNCSGSINSYVNVIAAPLVKGGKDTVLCKTSDYIDVSGFNAQPGGGQWTGTSIKNGIINPALLEAGKYFIYYTYTDNATSCVNQDTVEIEIQNGLDIPAISGDTILCIGDTVNLEAASLNEDIDTKYQWYMQGDSKSFAEGKRIEFLNNKSITIFAEAITPKKKCPSVRGKIDLTNDTPEGTISATKNGLEKEDYVKFAFSGTGSEYKWEFGDGDYSLEKSPSHYFYQPGLFTVKVNVTSPNGCTALFQKTDFIKVTGEDRVIITEADDNNFYPELDISSISGYPNPVSEHFNLDFSGVPSCDITVSDITGRVIHTDKLKGGKGMIDLSNYPSGYYLLTIKSDKVFKSIKVEKF